MHKLHLYRPYNYIREIYNVLHNVSEWVACDKGMVYNFQLCACIIAYYAFEYKYIRFFISNMPRVELRGYE